MSRMDNRLAGILPSIDSPWRANYLGRIASVCILGLTGAGFTFTCSHLVFRILARTTEQGFPFNLELGICLACLALMLAAAFLDWRLFRVAYELKDLPVKVTGVKMRAGAQGFQHLYPTPTEALSDEAAILYSNELLLNAFVNPRSIFARISERIQPEGMMLHCDADFEFVPPAWGSIQAFGVKDLPSRTEAAVVSSLLIPLTFQKRGELVPEIDITGASGGELPRLKQSVFADQLLDIIQERVFADGWKAADDPSWSGGLREGLKEYLCRMETGPLPPVVSQTVALLQGHAKGVDAPQTNLEDGQDHQAMDRLFCQHIQTILQGLKDVFPVCVCIHVALVDGNTCKSFASPRRIFDLQVRQKIRLKSKPTCPFRNPSGNSLLAFLNARFSAANRRFDTVYYSLARAERSTSYHLYLQGPANTYYARGSLLEIDPLRAGKATASYIETQRRYGQNEAHIYIRDGQGMDNVAFMFRYLKTPLDTFHIMFIAALLCLTALSVTAVSSLVPLIPQMSGLSTSLPAPAMLLAIASASGPWIYNRAVDGKAEGSAVGICAVLLPLCCALGLVLYFAVALGSHRIGLDGVIILWSLIVAAMMLLALGLGYTATLHSLLYRYLSRRREGGWDLLEGIPSRPLSPSLENQVPGMRSDTPRGTVAENHCRLWLKGMQEES